MQVRDSWHLSDKKFMRQKGWFSPRRKKQMCKENPVVNPRKRRLKTQVNKHTQVLMEMHPGRTGLDPITIKVFYFLEF